MVGKHDYNRIGQTNDKFFVFIFKWGSFRLIKYRVRFLNKKKSYRVSPYMGEANLVSEPNPQYLSR